MRKRGIISSVINFVLTLVGIGILCAVLSAFGWDVFAVISWCLNWLWEMILKIAEMTQRSPIFRSIFGT